MRNSLYKLFEHKCVLEVCTHPHYNDKNPPIVFLIPILKSPFLNQAVLRFLSGFDRFKNMFFYTILRNFSQTMLLFIKTLNNHINLGKMGIR